jgi:hypothetical protein
MRDSELDGLMQLGLTKKDIKPWRAIIVNGLQRQGFRRLVSPFS